GGLVGGRRRSFSWGDRLCHDSRQSRPGHAEHRSRRAPHLGADALPDGAPDYGRADLCDRERTVWKARARAGRLAFCDEDRPGRPPARRARRGADSRLAAGREGAEAGRGPGVRGADADRIKPARRLARDRQTGIPRAGGVVQHPNAAPHRKLVLMIVTVTLNAAIDRTLNVPNFQLGHRHRASDALTLAGGKGINAARALKRRGVPVVATGLAGGRTGTRIIEELTGEAILNDFVRIGGESRTSTAVVDPTAGTYTEINEWGPQVEPEELQMLLDQLHSLRNG